MNFKKKFALLTLLLLVALATPGCGGDDKNINSEPESENLQSSEVSESIDSSYLTGVLAKGMLYDGLSYDLKFTAAGQTSNVSYFMEGNKFKVIGNYEGMESITIVDGENMITYDPIEKTGIKVPYDDFDSFEEGFIDANLSDDFDPTYLTFIDKEDYDGSECLVVSSKDPASMSEIKLWINEDLGMVVKTEGTSPDGQVFSSEITNIKTGSLDEDTFSVPNNIQIMELPGM